MNPWLLFAIGLGLVAWSRRGASSSAAAAAATAQRQAARDGAWPDHAASSIEVVDVQPHTFADSCLGVGAPEEVCAQALTPGYLVQLRANGRVLEYHVAGDRARLCPPCSARLNRGPA